MKRGFTLIELLVVISILGLLIGITGQRSNMAYDRSRDAAVMLQLEHLRTALHQYALENAGKYPEKLEELSPKYLPKQVLKWRGSRAAGTISYDPQTGKISLADESGISPQFALDSRGRPYADY